MKYIILIVLFTFLYSCKVKEDGLYISDPPTKIWSDAEVNHYYGQQKELENVLEEIKRNNFAKCVVTDIKFSENVDSLKLKGYSVNFYITPEQNLYRICW